MTQDLDGTSPAVLRPFWAADIDDRLRSVSTRSEVPSRRWWFRPRRT